MKTVSNDWWASGLSIHRPIGLTAHRPAGSTTYQGFSPQYESRLVALAYPSPVRNVQIDESGKQGALGGMAANLCASRSRLHQTPPRRLATTGGDVQPWVVTRQCLLFNSSLANNQPASAATFSDTSLVQMNIPRDGGGFNLGGMEPAIEGGFTNRKALVIPEVAGWATTTDTTTTLGGKHGVSAGIPDHWIMLPKDTPKVISVGSSLDTAGLRTAYRFSGRCRPRHGCDGAGCQGTRPIHRCGTGLLLRGRGRAIHVAWLPARMAP